MSATRVTNAMLVDSLARVERGVSDLRAQVELLARIVASRGHGDANMQALAAELEPDPKPDPEEARRAENALDRLNDVWGPTWRPTARDEAGPS